MPIGRLLPLVAVFAFGLLAASQPPTTASAVHRFLRAEAQFTDADIVALERNQPVARVLREVDKRELNAFGAVRVHATSAFLLDRIRDIVSFKENPMVLQIGRFSNPPRLEDLAALTLDRDEIDALKRCRPGSCALRLPAEEMARIRTGVNWAAADAAESATRMMRGFMLRRVQAYVRGGGAALGAYHDKKQPVVVADEFEKLLVSPLLLGDAPDLRRYVLRFPADPPPSTEDFLYWSRERFGFKPVVSITHIIISQPAARPLIGVYVASKQIYASHYFDAALAVTAAVDATADNGRPAFYMMYLNRSRTPMLEGFFAALTKGLVRGRTRDGLIETLRVTKQRLEAAFVRRQASGVIER